MAEVERFVDWVEQVRADSVPLVLAGVKATWVSWVDCFWDAELSKLWLPLWVAVLLVGGPVHIVLDCIKIHKERCGHVQNR